jgi:hypothetical protein
LGGWLLSAPHIRDITVARAELAELARPAFDLHNELLRLVREGYLYCNVGMAPSGSAHFAGNEIACKKSEEKKNILRGVGAFNVGALDGPGPARALRREVCGSGHGLMVRGEAEIICNGRLMDWQGLGRAGLDNWVG